MAQKQKGKCEFEKNILELSVIKDLAKLPEEWQQFAKEDVEPGTIQCICGNKNIKHVSFFMSNLSGRCIPLGGACAKKCKIIEKRGGTRSLLCQFLSEYSAEYETITNLELYSDSVFEKLLLFLECKRVACQNVDDRIKLIAQLEQIRDCCIYNNKDVGDILKMIAKLKEDNEAEDARKQMEAEERRARAEKEVEERRLWEEREAERSRVWAEKYKDKDVLREQWLAEWREQRAQKMLK